MKNALLLFLIVFISPAFIFAQAKKQLKSVESKLEQYEIYKNIAYLESAEKLINEVVQSTKFKNDPSVWITKANIHLKIAKDIIRKHVSQPKSTFDDTNAGIDAYKAFQKAEKIAKKRSDKKQIVAGFQKLLVPLGYAASTYSAKKDHKKAFECSSVAIDIHKTLKADRESSSLDEMNILADIYIIAFSSGYLTKKDQAVKSIVIEMIQLGFDKYAFLYEDLHQILNAENHPDTEYYLKMGRTKFPDNRELILAEIKYHLKKKNYEKTIDLLKVAIKQDPTINQTYFLLAEVNELFYLQLEKENKQIQAEEYFYESIKYYLQADQKMPDDFSIQYRLGAIYYSKASFIIKNLNQLRNDTSPKGTKKYDALKAEMDNCFHKAIPYFKAAFELNKEDINTMILLEDLYSRTNQPALALVYKSLKKITQQKQAITQKGK